MRLIDADELLKHQRKMNGFGISPEEDYWTFAVHATDIKDAPTIDPESMRPQGEWIDKPTGRYGAWQSWCSVCGKHSGIGGIESNRHKPYCPNCGAPMKRRNQP